MKNLLFLLTFFTIFSFSQSKKNKTDSINYFLELANYSFEEKYNSKDAIKYVQKAINYSKATKNNEKLYDCYYFLGSLHLENNNYNDAIINFIKCSNYYEINKISSSKVAKINYALGTLYLEKRNFTIAKMYFDKAYLIYSEINSNEAFPLLELQKGLTLKASNKLDEAAIIFKKIANTNRDVESSKVEAIYQLSKIYYLQEDYQKALEYSKKALELVENNSVGISKKKILNNLILISEKLEDYKLSNFYLKEFLTLNEIKNNSGQENTELLINKKEHDNQLEIVEKLEKEKSDQMKSIRFSRLISIMSIVLIAILSLLSFSLYKNNKIRTFTYKLLQAKNKELTEQKEKAEFASKARSEFLSTVSHELRTPLNAINGITYLLLQEKPKTSQLNYLKSLEFSGNYLLSFINDILEINRLESNNVHVEKIKFNLVELVNNINQSFSGFISKNNINFKLDLDIDGNENLIGDPTKLSQILINLINNSIKFTKNGEVILKINTVKEKDNKITLKFVVQDNGIGIPEDKIANIFDSFSQGSVEINRTYGGTGLGLSIVKKIIEILDSEIHLESKVNKGTKFYFNLDFDKSDLKTISSIETNQIISHENLKGKRVLLVEDNKINQMITKKMVENKGMICTIIDNGEDSIVAMENNKFDMVLMDVHLPGINGTEATAEIRKFDTITPIIALTAISLNENREMLLSYGMNDVVTKPFAPEHFYNVISSYFKA
ncbi:response regulator [Flavobacterium sp. F372]|uniref:histidine kinase n=1 Tax=Flavobacterium bernardetii TaxID=2813823 RepID=A0ABR7IY06_9FLAO|nr:ATP-binding protein [Flavobacterium bernardetii]MBC5834603.1 response regulator [Flavobacterium bernardetii]NHF70251.1 response regulator [Flavobacterium bernardetii]